MLEKPFSVRESHSHKRKSTKAHRKIKVCGKKAGSCSLANAPDKTQRSARCYRFCTQITAAHQQNWSNFVQGRTRWKRSQESVSESIIRTYWDLMSSYVQPLCTPTHLWEPQGAWLGRGRRPEFGDREWYSLLTGTQLWGAKQCVYKFFW